ncbi:MAG: guanylate kinase [Candidatus Thiothrix putei]|jgi:guanylate kinase|uniref:Guanylate kinase n=2 Tax=Thiothrix TaxID=1030 RepID=A0A1H4BS39_9GAMM|nr:guanylate kinase [Thiothrix caldifontis]WGZ95252.1 MAG: guanylate kinase [Candidatus Thiothrix putei]SEA50652.1 guanylate kinase [Thiothrix caldifontis]
MNTRTGQLYIVSAPSGAGKSSLLNALLERVDNLVVSVSHTTRQPRPGEQDGVHYHFTPIDVFRQQVADGNFLEYAQVFDNYYGTSRLSVDALRDAGKDVILEIDWQGAQQVRECAEAVTSIFILPPSVAALNQRLHGRGQDSEETIQRRMRDARSEMSHYPEYDYLIINDDFDTALAELTCIFYSARLKLAPQIQQHKTLLDALVG